MQRSFFFSTRSSLPIMLTLLAAAFGASRYLVALNGEWLAELTLNRIEAASHEISDEVEELTLALRRMAKRVDVVGVSNPRLLAVDSQGYLEYFEILRNIDIVDKTGKSVMSYPRESKGEKAGFSPNNIAAAVTENSGSLAFVRGEIDVPRLLSGIKAFEGYDFQLLRGEETLFRNSAADISAHPFTRTKQIGTPQIAWTLQMAPSAEFASFHSSNIPQVVLVCGILLALLVGRLLSAAQRRRDEMEILLDAAKRNQKERSELAARLELALSATELAAWSVDAATNEIWSSQRHDSIYGVAGGAAKWDFEMVRTLCVAEDQELFANWYTLMQRQEKTEFEFRIKRVSDGAIRCLWICSRLIHNADGKVDKLIGVVRDITDQKLIDEERLAALQWKKSLVNAAGYAIISTSPTGIIRSFNRAAEELLGYQADEVVGLKTPAVFHDVDETEKFAQKISRECGRSLDVFEAFVAKAASSGQPDQNEWTYIHKTGKRIPVTLSLSALKDSRGEITGYLGIAVDLTESRRAQELVQITNERLERVIRATNEGIWERDMVTGEVTYLDDYGKRLFGFEPHETVTVDDIQARMHPEDLARLTEMVQEHIEQRSERFESTYRLCIPGKGSEYRYLHTRGKVLLADDGRPLKTVATFADVTETVKIRTQLENALAEARTATEAKSVFLASVSHEIRTPLNGIIGMSDLLLRTKLTREQKSFATIAHNSATTLLHLINDILDYSKIEAGKMQLERTEFQLSDLIENHLEILSARAREKNLSLVHLIDGELPESFVGDSSRIGQVLLNLLGNAIKFTSHGGCTLRVMKGVRSSRDEMSVRFEVTDTGIGIKKDDLDKIFEPFTQADQSTSRKFGGTGLGLSISKLLVQGMGGTIGAKSSKSGSTFWFEIPLLKTQQSSPNRTLALSRETSILIIHSDPFMRTALELDLIAFGMKPVVCESGPAALKLVRQTLKMGRSFEIVVAGVANTRKDLALIQQLRKAFGKKSARWIAIAEFAQKIPKATLKKTAIHQLLRRPLRRSEFLDALENRSTKDVAKPVAKERRMMELGGARARVLVADDVAFNQLIAKKYLEQLGCRVHCVSNGLEVLSALERMEFDLVLMDCHMPELNGYDATQHVRKLRSDNAGIPIIALTANAMKGDAERCLDFGMNGYLAKPIRVEELQEIMEKWIPGIMKGAA
jgi:PAS domain S-box-containing protein